LAFQIKRRFVTEMYESVLDLPLQWHHKHHSGNVISRIKIASDALYNFSELQFQYIEHFFMFFGPLIALFILSPVVSGIAFVVAVLTIFVIGKFDKKLVDLFQRENDTQNEFMAAFFDCISNVRTVLALNLKGKTYYKINEKLTTAYNILVQSITYNQYKWAIVSLLIFIMEIGIIFYYIIAKTQAGNLIAIGSIVAMFQYLQQLSKMFFNIAACYQEIVHMQSNYNSISSIMKDHDTLCSNNIELPMCKDWNEVNLKNICFSYNDSEENVLSNISISLKRNSRIAIIGQNGSGKSTLLNIISGMLKADNQECYIDGIKSTSRLDNILIPQDPEIFEDTAIYNITVGDKYDRKDIEKIISIAKFDEVLKSLPSGINTNVMEKGVNLSGGEKQRLALCRGLYSARDCDIILLDEPTSSIDIDSEMKIYKNLFAFFSSKCLISIVHKLHLLPLFDFIYVMQFGKIVQKGTLEELKTDEQGYFSELWKEYVSK
jgi:ABC-type bacteriocin/lantibiotic exporter with double-glycine peptidase domain